MPDGGGMPHSPHTQTHMDRDSESVCLSACCIFQTLDSTLSGNVSKRERERGREREVGDKNQLQLGNAVVSGETLPPPSPTLVVVEGSTLSRDSYDLNLS